MPTLQHASALGLPARIHLRDKLAARYMSSLPQGGKAAQHVREYHREKEQP
jgi:hypothetical protein